MLQTSARPDISLTAKIILADYKVCKLKYPGGNVQIALVSQHSILVTILYQ